MIDHMGFGASDYDASMKFFTSALAPLGYKVVMEGPPGAGAGIGTAHAPVLWIHPTQATPAPLHIALRAEVDAFHQAALAAGGKDNGAPGLRPHYHPNYYGAFVIGPDGHNVEAVCHKPS